MQQELLAYVLNRLAGLYLIVELLILALNEIPGSADKWRAKKHSAFRRLCYYLALNIAVIWLITL